MSISEQTANLLAQQSVRGGQQKYTESQIRDLVGAPTIEEEQFCICGKRIDKCEDSYVHMTSGY